MNTFKKNSLYLAVAGVSALGAGSASAVALNADGLGNVLLYPYYTVREPSAGNAYNSLLSVVNSTGSAKAVKVRFLEGKNSREVLDFNLYLSAKDVWVAAIIPTADGAAIVTPDNSCTDGVVSQDESNPTPFVNYAYTGDKDDPANDDLDRTREGYVEIIEMGTMWGYAASLVTHKATAPRAFRPTATTSACSRRRATSRTTSRPVGWPVRDDDADQRRHRHGLRLRRDRARQLQRIRRRVREARAASCRTLNRGDAVSLVVDHGPAVRRSCRVRDGLVGPGNKPVDAVSAVLMHDHIYNEFVLDKGTSSGTDWVVTMPTKGVPDAYYLSKFGTMGSPGDKELKVTRLFQRNFKDTGACDDVDLSKYDREEKLDKVTSSFSPPPPTKTDQICWEANVITFHNSNVLGSKNVLNAATTFENGWATIWLDLAVSGARPARRSTLLHHLGGGIRPASTCCRARRTSRLRPRTTACRWSGSLRSRSRTATLAVRCRTTAATSTTSRRAGCSTTTLIGNLGIRPPGSLHRKAELRLRLFFAWPTLARRRSAPPGDARRLHPGPTGRPRRRRAIIRRPRTRSRHGTCTLHDAGQLPTSRVSLGVAGGWQRVPMGRMSTPGVT
ncbi:MAG: hypothetical protein IPI87_00765 [Betaproteobacteria bacterium]|nr:hypothetical protein [Betaproteobacteria bacterium]